MINYIAEEWVDGIDIKDYLRAMLIEYTDELNCMTDEQVQAEYNSMVTI